MIRLLEIAKILRFNAWRGPNVSKVDRHDHDPEIGNVSHLEVHLR
jgi:hypothetical protein